MGRIALLGWGSLIWNPRNLKVIGPWHDDGPMLPIEFARQSSGQRVTLVIAAGLPLQRTLWIKSAFNVLLDAANNLKEREGTSDKWIAFWPGNAKGYVGIDDVMSRWCGTHGLDGVVWTALPPKWGNEEGVIPTPEQLVGYLTGLSKEEKERAMEYIVNAPKQIDTPLRREIRARLGWA